MSFFKPSSKDQIIKNLEKENRRLRELCDEKDSYFMEMISDGMRHGSSLAAKHMNLLPVRQARMYLQAACL